MATVLYHANTRETRFEELPGDTADISNYALVAIVDADDAESIYALCQTVDVPWYENSLVILANGLEGARSLSVGDILHMADGRWLTVDRFGFREVNMNINF